MKTICGPTGEFPDGKLGPDDEGEINIAISEDEHGNVRLDFGKPIAWLAMPRGAAVEFALVILKRAGANIETVS